MAYKNMTKDEFHEFITKLYYWATSYFPEEMRNQTYELLLTLLDTYYPSGGSSKPSTESDCNMPRVSGSALKNAYDVCFRMKDWCENVIAGACDYDDTTADKKMLKKCNNFIKSYNQHYR